MTAIAPTKLTIFAYNVGFGDSFLLRFTYPDQSCRHVLIDLGSTERAENGPSIETVAKQIAIHCGGKLEMVVVTHRHADHLSGFSGEAGKAIAALKPDLVVQPWTERPDLDPNATSPASVAGAGSAGGAGAGGALAARRAAASSLREMNAVAGRVSARAQSLQAAGRAPKTIASEIHFLGETNIKNPAAVRNLAKLGRRQAYAQFGTRLRTATILPGIGIKVLGPPTLEQAPDIANLATKDATEYWHLAATMTRRSGTSDTEPLFPEARQLKEFPQAAKWVIPQIDRMSAEELLSIVRSIDDALNNTSLILLFEIGTKKLLFSGDAQIENWRYALFQAPNSVAIRRDLAKADVYKVGHHGSLNATPKTLWTAFEHRGEEGKPGRLQSVISTLAGKHGKPWRGTEVPRGKLMTAIKADSDLTDTRFSHTATKFWAEVEVDLV